MIIEAFDKVKRIEDKKRLKQQEIREAEKQPGGLSESQRFLKWLFKNPDKIITPLTAKSGIDANGNFIKGFPKLNYKQFRKSLLPKLRKSGIIRYYYDPLRKTEIKGQYQFNENYCLYNGDFKPPEEFHNVKIELRDPQKRVQDQTGRYRTKLLSQYDIKRIFENTPYLQFELEDNRQSHTWTLKAKYNRKIITVNINNNNSTLTEIWCACTNDPFNWEEYVEYSELLMKIIGEEICLYSDYFIKKLEINRDYKNKTIVEFNNYKVQFFNNDFLRVYNKKNSVRLETGYNSPMDFMAVAGVIKQGFLDKDKFELSVELSRSRKEIQKMGLTIEEIKETLKAQGFEREAQALELAKMNDNFRSFLELLQKEPSQEEKYDSFGFKNAQEMVEPPGYG